jgi:xanthine dehydrogenase YagR molybdenum-binding subunit
MATAEYPAARRSSAARVRMMPNGSIQVMTATHDIGTGMYTILAQTAGDALGLPIERITVLIGDSSLPPAPGAFGSVSTASVTPAVYETAKILRTQLLDIALADQTSALAGRRSDEIAFGEGRFFLRGDSSVGDTYADIMRRSNRPMLEVTTLSMPAAGPGFGPPASTAPLAPYDLEQNSDTTKYAFNAFGAQFAEVWVDQALGIVRVNRFVSVMDIGQLMNEKTARSQIIGSVIYGIGSALMEETNFDLRYANPVVRTLADYHVPVHLDIPPIEVHFIGKSDPHISPLGAKGGGEIGTVGVSAAIANAVFNATGKRIRELPLTPDKLI